MEGNHLARMLQKLFIYWMEQISSKVPVSFLSKSSQEISHPVNQLVILAHQLKSLSMGARLIIAPEGGLVFELLSPAPRGLG